MSPSSERPLAAFRQELPYHEIAPLALHLAATERGVAFLDGGGDPDTKSGGRWSVLGWRPRRTFAWPAGRKGAIEGLRTFIGPPRLLPDPKSPVPFRGGFLGWISYDIGRDIERLPERHPADPRVPDFVLAEYEALLVEDRRDRRLFLTGTCDREEGPSRILARQAEALEALERVARTPREPSNGQSSAAATDVRAVWSRDEYLAAAERVLELIRAGDIFQANLSQRFVGHAAVVVPEMYRRLRAASPAPYGALFRLGPGPDVLAISPELFLERRSGRVVTRPIKGTRPRGADPGGVDDERLTSELFESEKDRAELAMIVDLLRNDLGRVAKTGSVVVTDPRSLVRHPTVHHAVAEVVADLAPTVHAADLLRATMPGGSVTGAPKIRAMEILEELEDQRRGPYCGAAGWFGHDGDLVLNILIRTLLVDDGRVSFRVGGGIVADSDAALEYDETLVKAQATLAALSAAAGR